MTKTMRVPVDSIFDEKRIDIDYSLDLENLRVPLYSSLEEEQERIKRLYIEPTLSPLIIPPEKRFAETGSIEPSTSVAEKPTHLRPTLPAPNTSYANPIPRTIALQMDRMEFQQENVDFFEKEVSTYLDQMKEHQAKLQALVEEEIKVGKMEDKWSVWETIVNYFTAASSLVIGAGLIATNGDQGAGICLIAAGGLSLINQLMADTNGWEALVRFFTENEEKQQTIAQQIQTGMFIVSVSLAISGLALAAYNNNLADAIPKDKERILKIVTLATSLLNGGTQLIKGAIQKRSCSIQADIIRTNGQMADIRKILSQLAFNQQDDLKDIANSNKAVKQLIQTLS